jgi:predicted protein tyrosine phosphatase
MNRLPDPPLLHCRLTVCGLTELDSFASEGVTHVLSIADPGTPVEPYFERYDAHHRLDLRFHDIIDPIPGMEMPTREHVRQILAFGDDLARHGESLRHLLIHCHMGVSRSTASMIMLLAQRRPGEEEAVIDRVAEIRPQTWPNSLMIGFADEALGCGGRLSRAIVKQYRRVAATRPDFVEAIRQSGRAREAQAAA